MAFQGFLPKTRLGYWFPTSEVLLQTKISRQSIVQMLCKIGNVFHFNCYQINSLQNPKNMFWLWFPTSEVLVPRDHLRGCKIRQCRVGCDERAGSFLFGCCSGSEMDFAFIWHHISQLWKVLLKTKLGHWFPTSEILLPEINWQSTKDESGTLISDIRSFAAKSQLAVHCAHAVRDRKCDYFKCYQNNWLERVSLSYKPFSQTMMDAFAFILHSCVAVLPGDFLRESNQVSEAVQNREWIWDNMHLSESDEMIQ